VRTLMIWLLSWLLRLVSLLLLRVLPASSPASLLLSGVAQNRHDSFVVHNKDFKSTPLLLLALLPTSTDGRLTWSCHPLTQYTTLPEHGSSGEVRGIELTLSTLSFLEPVPKRNGSAQN